MKKVIITALAAGAVVFAAPAHADSADDQFIGLLDQHHVDYSEYGRDGMIHAAHQFCSDLRSGKADMETVIKATMMSGFSAIAAGNVVGAAVVSYCPDQASKLSQS